MATYNGDEHNNTYNGTANADSISGFAGNDSLSGGAGNDSIYGGDDQDTLIGGADADLLDGGNGFDLIDYSASGSAISINLALGTGSGGDAQGDTLFNIEAVTGSANNDTLIGDDFANLLTGGAGDDSLDGGIGDDTMVGGIGNDTFIVDSAGDVVTENLNQGDDLVYSSVSYQLTNNVERLTLTGNLNLTGQGNGLANLIVGNSGNGDAGTHGDNYLFGSGGNDTIYGMGGDDTLDGGAGADSLIGGSGNDLYVIDNAGDVVYEANAFGGGNDTVSSSNMNIVLGTNVENAQLTGLGNLTATGNGLDNAITGNDGNNYLMGLAGIDSLYGGAGNDTLDGGTEGDTMAGGAGNDIYYVDHAGDTIVENADEGIDTVHVSLNRGQMWANVENLILDGTANLTATGNDLDNVITGNIGNNAITGSNGNDTIYGGDGNDTIDGGTGNDSMVGGLGNDFYKVSSANDVVTEMLNQGTDTVEISVDWDMSFHIENLTMSGASALSANGNSLDNVMTGNGGANTLNGKVGNDTLYGGDGSDTLVGGSGDNVMYGGKGNDNYVVQSETDNVTESFNQGFDTVTVAFDYTLGDNIERLVFGGDANTIGTGNGVNNTMVGNGGDNELYGLAGNDTIRGNTGNDTLDGGTGNDVMFGGDDNDTYYVDSVQDKTIEFLLGGTNDVVYSSVNWTMKLHTETLYLTGTSDLNGTGTGKDNTLHGNSGNNILNGLNGSDTIYGYGGNDTIDGGNHIDTMVGGDGDDTYYVSAPIGLVQDTIIELADEGIDTVFSVTNYTLGANLENLTLIGSGNKFGTGNELDNYITGNSAANRLNGGDGSDTLDGGSGADTLDGGSGDDSMIGGLGNDTYIVDSEFDTVVEASNGGIDIVRSTVSYALGDGVEKLYLTGSDFINGFGNSSNNYLAGNWRANELYGGTGNDTIYGNFGNDTLDGGAGNDQMVGGVGDDTYYVDSTVDQVIELANEGTDLVYSTVNFTLSTDVEDLILIGTGNTSGIGNGSANNITGNSGDNLLSGNAGNDVLIGNDGNDTMNGGFGDDTMVGGLGDDTYVVDSPLDVIIELEGQGTDTLQTAGNATLFGSIENLTLTGSSNYSGTGSDIANVITGNSGSNVLNGAAGDDTIIGASGSDTITGGEGADHFVFFTNNSGSDTITDFNDVNGGVEQGDLLEFVGAEVGVFAYLGAGAFTGTGNTEARFQNDAIFMDFNGNGTTDMIIHFTGLTSDTQIDANDFLFT